MKIIKIIIGAAIGFCTVVGFLAVLVFAAETLPDNTGKN